MDFKLGSIGVEDVYLSHTLPFHLIPIVWARKSELWKAHCILCETFHPFSGSSTKRNKVDNVFCKILWEMVHGYPIVLFRCYQFHGCFRAPADYHQTTIPQSLHSTNT